MSTQPFRVNCYLCAFLTHWRPTPKRTCLTAACRAGRDSPRSPPCIASPGFGAVYKVRLGGQRGSVKQEPQPWASPTEPAPAPQAGGPSEQLPVLPAPRPSSAVSQLLSHCFIDHSFLYLQNEYILGHLYFSIYSITLLCSSHHAFPISALPEIGNF